MTQDSVCITPDPLTEERQILGGGWTGFTPPIDNCVRSTANNSGQLASWFI